MMACGEKRHRRIRSMLCEWRTRGRKLEIFSASHASCLTQRMRSAPSGSTCSQAIDVATSISKSEQTPPSTEAENQTTDEPVAAPKTHTADRRAAPQRQHG